MKVETWKVSNRITTKTKTLTYHNSIYYNNDNDDEQNKEMKKNLHGNYI